MRSARIFLLCAASLACTPTLAATPGQPTSSEIAADAAQDSRKKTALELASYVTGQGIAATSSRNLLDSVISQMFEQNPELVALNGAFPGLDSAVRAALAGPLEREVARATPLYTSELADLYASNLTEVEIRQSVDFFRSPNGAALFAALGQNMKLTKSANEISSMKPASAEALKSDLSITGIKAIYALPADQRAKIISFFNSPTGKTLSALNEKKAEIDLKWFNYLSPEGEKEVEAAVIETMLSHIAKTDPKTSDAIRQELEKAKAPAASK